MELKPLYWEILRTLLLLSLSCPSPFTSPPKTFHFVIPLIYLWGLVERCKLPSGSGRHLIVKDVFVHLREKITRFTIKTHTNFIRRQKQHSAERYKTLYAFAQYMTHGRTARKHNASHTAIGGGRRHKNIGAQ